MKIFDTHAHLGLINDDPVELLRVLQQAEVKGVNKIVSICNSLRDFSEVYEKLKNEPAVLHAIGVSPSQVTSCPPDWKKIIVKKIAECPVVAIGETGLDYCKRYGDKRSQIELFISHLDIARQYDLPVIIHNRDAGRDILNILKDRIPKKGAVFHCYSEDVEFAKQALDLPVYFSFAGNVTYKNATNLHATLKYLPLERVFVESESPFLPPSQFTKQRNMPANIVATVNFMARLVGKDVEELAAILYNNSCKFFNVEG